MGFLADRYSLFGVIGIAYPLVLTRLLPAADGDPERVVDVAGSEPLHPREFAGKGEGPREMGHVEDDARIHAVVCYSGEELHLL